MTDQTVLVAPNLTRSNRKYHTDHDCHNASERAREISIEQAKRRGCTECMVCTNDVEQEFQGWTHQRALKAAAEAQTDD